MKKLLIAFIAITTAVCAARAGSEHSKPTAELRSAMKSISQLDAADFTALKNWMSGQGRQSLRDRGINDADIGGPRLDTDRFGDAPLAE